jgi:hypothetical protein
LIEEVLKDKTIIDAFKGYSREQLITIFENIWEDIFNKKE